MVYPHFIIFTKFEFQHFFRPVIMKLSHSFLNVLKVFACRFPYVSGLKSSWYICCTPIVEIYHPWIKWHYPWKFVLSMDERAHSSSHLTRLVKGICIKFHESKFIPWNQRRIPWMYLIKKKKKKNILRKNIFHKVQTRYLYERC